MPQSTDYHGWTIPVPHTESDEDKDQWGDILVGVLDDAVDDEVILKDTIANRPAPGVANRWFLATDENPPGLYLDNGASWVTIWDGDADTLDGTDSSAFALKSRFPIPNSDLQNSTVTVAGNAVGLGGSTAIAHADLSTSPASAHHTRPTAGAGLSDNTNTFDVHERLNYEPGHTEWEAGLASEEVKRITPPTGAAVHIDAIEFRQKGGGSSTSVSVEIYDATAAAQLASVNLGSADRTGYSGGSGNTVLIQITNSLANAVNAEPAIRGRIN